MSKKVFNVFSILCFALVLCFMGCTELINPKTETDINLNIDLSKIIKSTRNTGETQSSASLGENPTIKVAIYDAKKYNATTNSTDTLDLITEAQAKIANDEAKVKLNNIPVGIYAIVFAELSFSNGNSTEVMYAGNSKVFKVKASDNKISLVLMKVVNSETYPDDTNTPYEISSWDELETEINILSDDSTKTEFKIMNNLTATSTITVSKPVKIISDKNVTITRGNSIDGANFEGAFFRVESAGNLELEGTENITITLDGGNANKSPILATAPLITSSGNLTLTNCTLQNNKNTSDTPGGAINISAGTFTMNGGIIGEEITESDGKQSWQYAATDSDFSNYAYAGGGGIYVASGDVTINGGKISHNYTRNPENDCLGKTPENTAHGGGISIEEGSLSLINSEVSYNSGYQGGGIRCYNDGTSNTGTLTLNKTLIKGNTSNPYRGSSFGGGLMVNNFNVTFAETTESTIEQNYSGDGGALFLENTTSTLKNITIQNNSYKPNGYHYGSELLLWANANVSIDDSNVNIASTEVETRGIFINNNANTLKLSGDAKLDAPIYLTNGTTVTVAGELTAENVATITPSEYTVDTQVLTVEGNVNLVNYVGKFALTSSSEDGTQYVIGSNGMIALVSQNYAKGLTCVVDSDYNTVTLYISNADGLATFRDIVNGTLPENTSVRYDSNENSNYKFEANKPYPSVNGTLRDSITLSGEWTPIGVYFTTPTSAKPYSGTFDGNGKTITFENITHNDPDMYSSGLFQMLAGTVKNLIIAGNIFRVEVGYIGSITGYLDGGIIENCVNEALITNSATNGTGGIVGYVGTAGGKITGCINLMKVSSSYSTVGGIVGNVGNMPVNSNLTISKCINLGEISGESNISGILGNANTSAISISDCMNLGKISTNNTSEIAYASGITTPSENYTVSSCINVGEVTATVTNSFQGGISSVTTKGIYTNNYYDSTVNSSVVDSSTSGITGTSTNNLIGSNISLNGISTNDWTFAEGRYPLPNIAGNIPGYEDGVIWSAVIKAATPKVTSGGGNDPLVGTEVASLSDLQNAINGNDEVIIIKNNITITDPLVINKKIKICTSDLNYQLVRATEGTVKGPMFEVTSTGELILQNIIITGGYDSGYDDAENNPFIYNNGKTVIENSTLKNNYLYYTGEYTNNESKSIHFYGGGAIFSNGDLTINNSSMENFYINSSGGGTIYIESGTCNIDVLTISSCSTNKNGAALYISENASSSTVNINNSNIVSNIASTNGGGIYAAAGTININNSEIKSNSAKTGKSVYFKKTVIYSINGNALVTVTTTSGYDEDITSSTSSISIN